MNNQIHSAPIKMVVSYQRNEYSSVMEKGASSQGISLVYNIQVYMSSSDSNPMGTVWMYGTIKMIVLQCFTCEC